MLLNQIAAAVKDELGPEAVVGVRAGGSDFPKTILPSMMRARWPSAWRKRGTYRTSMSRQGSPRAANGASSPPISREVHCCLVRRIREKTTLPLIAALGPSVTRTGSPGHREGTADLVAVALGRPLLADPDLPVKGFGFRSPSGPASAAMRELHRALPAKDSPRSLCGGGKRGGRVLASPATPAAKDPVSSLAAVSWHAKGVGGRGQGYPGLSMRSILQLGGLLKTACVPSFKEDLRDYLTYMRREVASAGVCQVLLDTPVTPALSGGVPSRRRANGNRQQANLALCTCRRRSALHFCGQRPSFAFLRDDVWWWLEEASSAAETALPPGEQGKESICGNVLSLLLMHLHPPGRPCLPIWKPGVEVYLESTAESG